MGFDLASDTRKQLVDLCELYRRDQVGVGVLRLGLRNTIQGLDDALIAELIEVDEQIGVVLEYSAEAHRAFEIKNLLRGLVRRLQG